MRTQLFLAAALLLSGCGDKDDTGTVGYEGDAAGECSDGEDNDGDGAYDCDDPDCAATAECEPEEVEGDEDGECSDDVDNDGDGATDCDDDGCADSADCAEVEELEGDEDGECSDGEDNDGDGATDCDDPDCDEDAACANQAPGSPGVLLTPAEATTSDDLTCTVTVEATDPDGDPVSYSTAWVVDSELVYTGGETTWSHERTVKGQAIQCLMYATDGLDVGTPGTSSTVTILNSAPSIAAVAIEPSAPAAGELLRCSWTGYDDADYDDDASEVSWTIDGAAAGSGSVLDASIAGGQEITCSVTAHDGEDAGNTLSATVEVGNSPPALAAVWLTPTDADVLSTLRCTPGTTEDADGDTVTYTYAWSVDGAAIAHSSSSLDLDLSYEGAEVQCSVTPFDGTDRGTSVDSNVVTVQSGPVLEVDLSSWDFGVVDVGCTDTAALTITNTGTDDLLISSATITGDPELDHDIITPAVIGAGASRSWDLAFEPSDAAAFAASLVIASNDPRGSAGLALFGEGAWVSHAESEVADLDGILPQADIIIAVDRSGSMSTEIVGMTDGLPGLTDVLRDYGVDYQLAATVNDDGCIVGSELWIDDSFSDSDAMATMEEMVDLGGSYGGNTERAFMLLQATVEDTDPGDCNDGLMREDASLHLLGLSDEPEQSGSVSGLSWTDYVAYFQAYKTDPSQVVFHAIGGDYPSGCGGSSAYTGMYEATVATGGAFVSICTTDWEATMAELGEAMAPTLGEAPSFALDHEPADSSAIVVRVNGTDIAGSWTYDASSNSITVSASAIEDGDTIVIAYDGFGC